MPASGALFLLPLLECLIFQISTSACLQISVSLHLFCPSVFCPAVLVCYLVFCYCFFSLLFMLVDPLTVCLSLLRMLIPVYSFELMLPAGVGVRDFSICLVAFLSFRRSCPFRLQFKPGLIIPPVYATFCSLSICMVCTLRLHLVVVSR